MYFPKIAIDPIIKADIIKELHRGNVDRVLSKIDETENVITYRLDKLANTIGVWP